MSTSLKEDWQSWNKNEKVGFFITIFLMVGGAYVLLKAIGNLAENYGANFFIEVFGEIGSLYYISSVFGLISIFICFMYIIIFPFFNPDSKSEKELKTKIKRFKKKYKKAPFAFSNLKVREFKRELELNEVRKEIKEYENSIKGV